jgi:hypothetical protein
MPPVQAAARVKWPFISSDNKKAASFRFWILQYTKGDRFL